MANIVPTPPSMADAESASYGRRQFRRRDDDDDGDVPNATRLSSFLIRHRRRPVRGFTRFALAVVGALLYGKCLLSTTTTTAGSGGGRASAVGGGPSLWWRPSDDDLATLATRAAIAAALVNDTALASTAAATSREVKAIPDGTKPPAVVDPRSLASVSYADARARLALDLASRATSAERLARRRARRKALREAEERREKEREEGTKKEDDEKEGRFSNEDPGSAGVDESAEEASAADESGETAAAAGVDVSRDATAEVTTEKEKEAMEYVQKLTRQGRVNARRAARGQPPIVPGRKVGLRGSRGGSRSDRRHLVPFITVLSVCTLLRACVSLLVRMTVDDDDEGNDEDNEGDERRRRGLFRRMQRQTARTVRGTARAAARARYQALVDRLNEQRVAQGERPISAESLRLVLSSRDFNGDDYERLLRFDEESGPAVESLLSSIGATDAEINRCPGRVIQSADDDLLRPPRGAAIGNDTGNNGVRRRRQQSCAVCLEPYEVGDAVRTIPCFHTFHQRCIDPWMRQKAECPVCKHPAIG